MIKPIYLDNQATTPVDSRVKDAMIPYLSDQFGNAASIHHSFGRHAKEAVENSRKILANEINARPKEIVFTSGATESINLAIRGICEQNSGIGHIITQATEHKAVLDTCDAMAKKGWDITILPVYTDGRVDPSHVKNAIRDNTALVAIMHANNEIGTIQPIAEIGSICRNSRATFLVDASQSYGKLLIDVETMQIDFLAATAHKIYGPKGIGLLYVKGKSPKLKMTTQITGGGHEYGLRSGTLPVHQIVGFGKAIEICNTMENEKMAILQKMLIDGIVTAHPDVQLNGSQEYRLGNNINISFPGLDAETLIIKMKGIACSTGSACSTANLEPSHVLKAIALNNEMAHSSIRFSLGRFNTKEEILTAIEEIGCILSEMKDKSPRNLLILN
jgi:cysteine desulfurase